MTAKGGDDGEGRLRREYSRGALHREDLHEDPFAQFEAWLAEAGATGMLDPNAMSLATVGADGAPSLRTVLLKYLDARGLVFFTNIESTKSREIAANPSVALLFYWRGLERQVAVRGAAERLPGREVLRYFLTRPRGSQLGAWVSSQSSIISSRALLEMKFDEMKRKFAGREVPLPSFWGGYRVSPRTFEFWQGRPNRLHDRFLYTRTRESAWRIDRLAP